MWRNWRRKSFVLVAALMVMALASGVASHAAYAKLKGDKVVTKTFQTTFSGVTPPYGELANGAFEVELFADKLMNHQNPQMTISVIKSGNFLMFADEAVCDDGATKGWCISARRSSWAFHPQFVNPAMPVNGSSMLVWGPGLMLELDGDQSGMATYSIKLDKPSNPQDGVLIVLDLNGFVSKVNKSNGRP